ncbi:hypothetical protein [Immundisolibacter cernigliae]|uniref:hypothetical protein n=1 Tax=Immundisolibacter cernigliae TaxID=1810504 RepID=UPI00096AD292|nr:hypothetical protein [Immundisolibacter cernigliae]
MSAKSGLRAKGRSSSKPFLSLPRDALNSPAWSAMTAHEVKLLIDVAAAYRGRNNGDLACTFSLMQKRGWSSKDTLAKALSGLLEKGFLTQTRQGGRHRCSLYAITWEPIHECDGKLDVRAKPVPLNAWREWQPQKIAAPAGGVHCPGWRAMAIPR